MWHTRVYRNVVVMMVGAAGGMVSGCGPTYADTLHSHFASFRVKTVGTLTWCARYEAGDLSAISVPRIEPGMETVIADKWDEFLSPRIQSGIHTVLQAKGYQVIDVKIQLGLRKGAELEQVLDAIAAEHKDLDAVLVVVYCFSPYHVRVVNQQSTGTSYNGTTSVSFSGDVDGINLKGRYKLFHLASRTMLWELGDHSDYCYGCLNMPEIAVWAKDEQVTAACEKFGSMFGRAEGQVRGFPACVVNLTSQ